MTDPKEVVPKGLPEKKEPALKTAPALKTMAPGSAAVRRCAVEAVDEKVMFPAISAVAVVPIVMVIALTAFRFSEQPEGTLRSVPATPLMVSVAAEELCRLMVVLFESNN